MAVLIATEAARKDGPLCQVDNYSAQAQQRGGGEEEYMEPAELLMQDVDCPD